MKSAELGMESPGLEDGGVQQGTRSFFNTTKHLAMESLSFPY